jgi:alkylation response protein AidB-like acyl-CoA dehydrogenase
VNLDLDDEQEMLQRTLKEFVARDLEPFLSAFAEAPLPRGAVLEILRMLQPFGMLNARVPVEDGGTGISHVTLGLLWEQLPAEVALDAAANDTIGMRLCQGGSDELKQRYLGPLARGEIMAGSAISEPDTGSDPSAIATTAELDGDEWVLNGNKVWSSHATIADVLLVAASIGKDARGRAIVGRFLVDTHESPVQARDLETIGLKRHHLGEVTLDRVRVPKGNLIGEPGDALTRLTLSWLSTRSLIGMLSMGIASKAYEASLAYAKERRQFGKPIGSFQLVQELLVEMRTMIDAGRFLCLRALDQLDRGVPARLESSLAKYYATDAGVKVTNMAVEVHGAIGLSCEHIIEKLLRDARMLTIPDGTIQIQKLMAGRELLGISAIR